MTDPEGTGEERRGRIDTSAVAGDAFHYREGTEFPDDVSVVPDHGEGCYLWTEGGDRYLDYLMGSGPLIVGHAHPRVVDAVQRQVEKGSAFYKSDRLGFELADRIVNAVPCADSLKFTSTGGEATYFALRLARAHTGNERVLKFQGAYHGFHDYAMRSSDKRDAREVADAGYPEGSVDSAGVVTDAARSTVVAPFNDLDATREVVEAYADELAAVILEPVMRSLPASPDFLAGVREICDEHDVVLIFDEVVTGFRLAFGGAQEFYGVTPDLATYGKAIGGGTPIGAVCGRDEIMSHTEPERSLGEDGVYISGTLSGNPLCAAAGHATLDVLEESGTYSRLDQYGEEFRSLVDDLLAESSLSGTSLGAGAIVDYVVTDADSVTRWETIVDGDRETKERLDRELLDEGLLHHIGGKRYISTRHGAAELEKTAEAFKRAMERV
ncbi:MAG: aspartate aminotransferase family protein [Haloferacaceae archaeon]